MAAVNPQLLFNYLVRQHQVTPAVAAGILANIEAESSFRTDAVGDGGTSGGLFQHHAGRWDALKQFAKRRGKNWTDWQVQIDYAIQEARDMGLNLSHQSAQDAAFEWTVKFERPADAQRRARERAARAGNFMFASQPPPDTQRMSAGSSPLGAMPAGDTAPRNTPQELYLAILDRLSHAVAGGRRRDPRAINPNGGFLDDPFEGILPDQYRDQIQQTYDWFDPSVFARAAASDDPASALSNLGISFETGGPGVDGDGGDWFRTGEAPNNFANRNNPLYVARKEFAVAMDERIEQMFDVQGSAGYYRPPDPSHAAPGGPSANSDHYSAGAVDYFGSPEELQRLRDWLVQQPFVAFVRWQSESHFDHVHVSYDLGWVAQNWFGSSGQGLPDFTTVDQQQPTPGAEAAAANVIPESMPETVNTDKLSVARSAGVTPL